MPSPQDRQNRLYQDLTNQGPEQVSLKGIIRKGEGASRPITPAPLDSFAFPEFQVPGKTVPKAKLSEEQLRTIHALESKVTQLEQQLAQCKTEIPKLQAAAHAKGKAEGLAQGLHEGQAKAEENYRKALGELESEVRVSLQGIQNSYHDRLAHLQDQTIDLALGITQHLFAEECQFHRDLVNHNISEAFSHLGPAENVCLHLHPLDVVSAEGKRSFWHPMGSAVKHVRIEPDERVERGGCWIESEGGGTVDFQISVILERVAQAVRQAYQQSFDQSDESELLP